MIKVRAPQAGDFYEVLDLINAAARADRTRRISEESFRRAWTGIPVRRLHQYGAVATARQDSVAGFIWWDEQTDRNGMEGWVHPSFRRRGIGTALLVAAETAARQHAPRTLTGRIYSDVPGGEQLFRRRAFEEVRRFHKMSVPLDQLDEALFPLAAPPLPGITIRTFRDTDLQALVEMDNAIFAGHWGIRNRTVSAWQRELQDSRPYDPSLWLLAWAENKLVGECLCHLSREGGPTDAWIAIVGVREGWRGRGLGGGLMTEALALLRRRGFTTASLHVDSQNVAAISLYRSMGLEVARTRLHFAKVIQS